MTKQGKDQQKTKEEVIDVTIERLLEINMGLNVIENNITCPRSLAFQLGMFKSDVEAGVKEYIKQKGIIDDLYNKKTKLNRKTGQRELRPEDREKMKKEKDALLDTKTSLKVRYFKLSDFEEVEDLPPSFFNMMKDLIIE